MLKSIRKALNIGADLEASQLAVFLMDNGFEGADLKQWNNTGIPDTAIALILEYYAYECRQDYRKEQAKRLCRVFRAIGFRVWAQKQLGWENESTVSIDEAMLMVKFGEKQAEAMGSFL